MPVYNEEASVRKVVFEWFDGIACCEQNFVFLAMDDGSRDQTLKILNELQSKLGKRLLISTHTNRGHGQTCLEGYRKAGELGADWIMQIDSDGQCDPQYFHKLWKLRTAAQVIYGVRKNRDDGFRRVVASEILRWSILLRFGTWIADPNVPYRLMRTAEIIPLVERIPSSFHLANVALALLCAKKGLMTNTVPIRFLERYGGEPTVPFGNFASKALELFQQLGRLLK